MTDLGTPTYDRKSPERIEFKRFDDLAQWWWGDDAFDPGLDFLSFPTGSIALELKLKSFAGAERFPHLRGLHLGEMRLSNLKEISGFEGLESLTIHGNNVRKLDPLAELRSMRLPACEFELHGQRPEGTGDLSPFRNLRELEVPFMKGLDLSALGGLRRTVAGYSSDLVLSPGARFGTIGSAAAPTGKWVNVGEPDTYRREHYPELKWWLRHDAAWRIER